MCNADLACAAARLITHGTPLSLQFAARLTATYNGWAGVPPSRQMADIDIAAVVLDLTEAPR